MIFTCHILILDRATDPHPHPHPFTKQQYPSVALCSGTFLSKIEDETQMKFVSGWDRSTSVKHVDDIFWRYLSKTRAGLGTWRSDQKSFKSIIQSSTSVPLGTIRRLSTSLHASYPCPLPNIKAKCQFYCLWQSFTMQWEAETKKKRWKPNCILT